VNQESSNHYSLQELPDINITFHQNNGLGGASSSSSASSSAALTHSSFQYLSQSTSSSQTLYILHQLVNNNNDLIDRLNYSEVEKQRLKTNYNEKEAEVYYLTKELEKREIQNARMKALINQASSTITITEQDYSILQKQVEILTKKMQLLMIENQKLSSYYHPNNGSSVVALNVSTRQFHL
jgi:uncharacterized coiled-coil protein SlyX